MSLSDCIFIPTDEDEKLLDNIDEAIKLAYAVANHYKCYTRIARV